MRLPIRLVPGLLAASVMVMFLVGNVAADRHKHTWSWHDSIEGSGKLVTKDREIGEFVKLDASGSYDIFITVGQKASLKITFDDNLIDLIDTRVRGKTLVIDNDESFSSDNSCKVEVTVTDLQSVFLNGSGDVTITELKGEDFECEVNGSGDVLASGEVASIDVSIDGSGDVDARELKAKEAYVEIRGSGDVDVFASETFDGAIFGSGDIAYYGNPPKTNTHVAGSGTIRRR